MTTVFYTATTLDGFIDDESDSLDWLFRQPQDDVDTPFDYDVFIKTVSALAMGATTYEWIRTSGLADDPWPYSQPTWVFTHRDLEPIPDADLRFTSAPVEQVHAEMAAAGDGDLWVVGGGGLAPSSRRPGCSTRSWCRSPRSRWGPGVRCFRDASISNCWTTPATRRSCAPATRCSAC